MAQHEKVAVLVHVIEARDLVPRSKAKMADPIVCVETMKEKEYSKIFKKDLAPYFNHYFHIEANTRDFATEEIRISVYDTSTFFRREMIGSFVFDMSNIHKQPNHEYFRTWVMLIDNSTDATKKTVQGYLKLSITVLKAGEEPVQHEEEESEETDAEAENLANMVLLKPKGLEGVESTLRAKIFRVEGLPQTDTMGKCDPFVEVRFGQKNRTSVKKNTFAADWNEELQIPVTVPTVADNIVMKVFDEDPGKDDLISTTIFSFKEIQSKSVVKPMWLNMYYKEGQNNEKTDFAGRILVDFSVTPGGSKIGVMPVPHEAEPPVTNYTVHFDLLECHGLKASNKVYAVVSIGKEEEKNNRIVSSEKHVEKGNAEFYESLPDFNVSYPTDTTQVPDIFVYVYEHATIGKDNRIGYLRYTYNEFANFGATPRWEMLKKKKSDSKDDEQIAGFIQFRASIAPSSSQQSKPRAKTTKPQKKAYQLRAHIYAGKDLPAGDEDGLSDPYVLVSIAGAKDKTRVVERSVYPDWYQTVALPVELPDQPELSPDINVIVYDYDKVSSDEFLGRFVVPIKEASIGAAPPKEPKWYPLVLKAGKGKGAILASFQLVPAESAASVPVPQLKPNLVETEVEIGVVRLTELAPFQLLPVANPFIQFSLAGSKQVICTKQVKATKGRCNFFENITLKVAIPESPIFSPALQVEVIDVRPLRKVVVAVANIPLASHLPWVPIDSVPTPLGVNLPPKVEETSFYTPDNATSPTTTTTTAADAIIPSSGTSSASDRPDFVAVDVAEPGEETDSLLGKGKGKRAAGDISMGGALQRRDIPETTVPGMEEEPEPPQGQQLPAELEHQMKVFPFMEVDLRRGTSKGISSGNIFNKPEAPMGKLKYSLFVRAVSGAPASSSSKKGDPRAKARIDVSQLAVKNPYVLRIYVEVGQNLVPHDDNGYSDPYIVVKNTGKLMIKDEEHVQLKTLQPQYYKMYVVQGVLPDENELRVQLFDQDKIGSDEFMGETKYDLEMLWFSHEWRQMSPKPKEYRTLWSPLSSFPQGKLRMWLELMSPEEAARTPPTPIAPPTKEAFELRIIVWETKNVVPKDKILGKESSDQFVMTKLLGHAQADQKTDVHDSVMDGCGKFNWRILYTDVFLPLDVPRLKIQVYDNEMIGANDAIAEANLNLKGFFQKALKNKSAKISATLALPSIAAPSIAPLTSLTSNINIPGIGSSASNDAKTNTAGPYNTGQWLELFHPSFDGVQGTICMELELLTQEDAGKNRVGRGRGEPNRNPFLPEPVRPKRSWLGDFMKFFGLDKLKKYLIIAGVVLVVLLILFIIIYFSTVF